MDNTFIDKIVSFLLGASIAFVLVGASLVFLFLKHYSVVLAFLVTFLFIFVSLFIIIMIDNYKIQKEILKELKKINS